jgi:hypothetical protein
LGISTFVKPLIATRISVMTLIKFCALGPSTTQLVVSKIGMRH